LGGGGEGLAFLRSRALNTSSAIFGPGREGKDSPYSSLEEEGEKYDHFDLLELATGLKKGRVRGGRNQEKPPHSWPLGKSSIRAGILSSSQIPKGKIFTSCLKVTSLARDPAKHFSLV